MKILLVTYSKVFPPLSGGHQRSLNLAKSMAACGHDVKILSLAGRSEDYTTLKPSFLEQDIQAGLKEITDLNIIHGLCQTLFRRISNTRVWTFFWHYFYLRQDVRRMMEEADCIFYDFSFFGKPRSLGERKPSFLISHNIESIFFDRGSFSSRRIFYPLVRYMERQAANSFDHVFTCSSSDTDFYQRYSQEVTEVPNGMARLPNMGNRSQLRDKFGLKADDLAITFAGSRFGPNEDGLKDLIAFIDDNEAALNKLGVRFLVAGSVSAKHRHGPLEALGFVDDINELLHATDVVLNPIRWGSGSNIKVYEAIAAAKPIISTKFGLRGLPEIQHPGLMVYDSQEELLNCIKLALKNKASIAAQGEDLLAHIQDDVLMDRIVAKRLEPVLRRFCQK